MGFARAIFPAALAFLPDSAKKFVSISLKIFRILHKYFSQAWYFPSENIKSLHRWSFYFQKPPSFPLPITTLTTTKNLAVSFSFPFLLSTLRAGLLGPTGLQRPGPRCYRFRAITRVYGHWGLSTIHSHVFFFPQFQVIR